MAKVLRTNKDVEETTTMADTTSTNEIEVASKCEKEVTATPAAGVWPRARPRQVITKRPNVD